MAKREAQSFLLPYFNSPDGDTGAIIDLRSHSIPSYRQKKCRIPFARFDHNLIHRNRIVWLVLQKCLQQRSATAIVLFVSDIEGLPIAITLQPIRSAFYHLLQGMKKRHVDLAVIHV